MGSSIIGTGLVCGSLPLSKEFTFSEGAVGSWRSLKGAVRGAWVVSH